MAHVFEIKLWHGGDKPERWMADEEPEYLPSGAVKFRCTNGLERYVTGSIEVTKREDKRKEVR